MNYLYPFAKYLGPDGTGGKKLYVEIIGVPAYFAFSGICRDVHLLYKTHQDT